MSSQAATAQLVLQYDGGKQTLSASEKIVLGRGKHGVSSLEALISRKHAELEVAADGQSASLKPVGINVVLLEQSMNAAILIVFSHLV